MKKAAGRNRAATSEYNQKNPFERPLPLGLRSGITGNAAYTHFPSLTSSSASFSASSVGGAAGARRGRHPIAKRTVGLGWTRT
jgi:hypothetical protein